MTEIRMTGELRTDYDCEANGMPAERWAEAVFKIGDEEIVERLGEGFSGDCRSAPGFISCRMPAGWWTRSTKNAVS